MAEGNDETIQASSEEEAEQLEEGILQAAFNVIEENQDSWYSSLRQLLDTGVPPEELDLKHKRELRLKATPYQLIQGILFRSNQ